MLAQFLLAVVIGGSQPVACPDTSDVGQFFSGFIAGLSPEERVPRGAMVLVCGDQQVFSAGFGKTQRGAPVDPERTVFRAASNSKLIAATAAMQLAASGRWKLTDDVNRYLPAAARLRDGYGRQVTVADLLTHTAGFEDKFAGGIALESGHISLAKFFERNRPLRVRPAGSEVSYSNIGMALAGYAVEVASGESFDTYAMKHIFTPLGMTRSTFAQPLPRELADASASAPPRAGRGIVFLPYPAASLVTTPNDMGRFIAAHLSADPAKIMLSSSSLADMHSTHWRPQPSVPGVAYGFFEGEMNGRRTLFHTGDSGDHSVVFLLPEERVGLYFVYTGSDEQTGVREKIVRAFGDRFFPPGQPLAHAPHAGGGTKELVGRYRGAAYSHSNYEKVKALFNQVSVKQGEKGDLVVSAPGGGGLIHFREREQSVFVGDSGEIIAFRKDEKGAVRSFTLSGSIWDPQTFERIGLLADGRLHLAAFAAFVLTMLARLLYVPTAALTRRIRRRPKPAYSNAERKWWRWSGGLPPLVLVTPVIGLAVAFLSFRPGAVAIPRAAIAVGIWLTLVSIAGLTFLPGTWFAWKNGFWSSTRRVLFTSEAVGLVIAAVLFSYWKILPF